MEASKPRNPKLPNIECRKSRSATSNPMVKGAGFFRIPEDLNIRRTISSSTIADLQRQNINLTSKESPAKHETKRPASRIVHPASSNINVVDISSKVYSSPKLDWRSTNSSRTSYRVSDVKSAPNEATSVPITPERNQSRTHIRYTTREPNLNGKLKKPIATSNSVPTKSASITMVTTKKKCAQAGQENKSDDEFEEESSESDEDGERLEREEDLNCTVYDWARQLVSQITGSSILREENIENIPQVYHYKKLTATSQRTEPLQRPVSSSRSAFLQGKTSSQESVSSRGSLPSRGSLSSRGSVPSRGSVSSRGSLSSRGSVPSRGSLASRGSITSSGSVSSRKSAPSLRPQNSRRPQRPVSSPMARVRIVQSEESLAAAAASRNAIEALRRAERLFGPPPPEP